METVQKPTLFDPSQAATFLGIAVQTMARWRVEGGGPPYLKLGSRVRYDQPDLLEWVCERRRSSTACDRPNRVA